MSVPPGEGRQTVLAMEITRERFEWALRHACLSHYVRGFRTVRGPGQGCQDRVGP
jgi:hypothetical protein